MRTLSAAILLVWLIGCVAASPKVEYLKGSEKVIHLKTGQPAPHDGWLLSDEYLADLYDLLERKAAQDGP